MNGLPPRVLTIPNLGAAKWSSPGLQKNWGDGAQSWVDDSDLILLEDDFRGAPPAPALRERACVQRAGPRRTIFFNPPDTTCAVTTCGGLCPGINDVVRSLVMHAHYGYGVKRFWGLKYGYESLNPTLGHRPVELTPDRVAMIQHLGGSVLGTSRGLQNVHTMVDQLERLNIDILFVVGGDGSQRGALEIFEEAARRNSGLSVIGIPKTIDNDLLFMDRSFGYSTAFSQAAHSLSIAHAEARGARNGIGLVKLMGRDSGFIACSAALATPEANFVLIPESPFRLDGPTGLLACLEQRLHERGHALVVVAEGAGQELTPLQHLSPDASGNKRYADIGLFLKEQIQAHFQRRNSPCVLKYIDPGYQLRGVVATPEDRIFCSQLGRNAVHAAMAGKTGMVVALWHQRYVHLPMQLVASGRARVDTNGQLWRSVLESTGQPPKMGT